MKPGDRLTLRIEKPVAGGRMLARHHGAIVLVAHAIPGELVEADVESVRRGAAWATTRRVLEASADRVAPANDPACGGAVYAYVRHERQAPLKGEILADAFARLARLPFAEPIVVAASPLDGHRMRARLHARGPRVGFYREGTHELCDVAATRQLLPETVDAVARLAAALHEEWPDLTAEIEISENVPASERACHVALLPGGDPSRLGPLREVDGVAGVSCGLVDHPRALTLWGTPRVTDDIEIAREGQAGASPVRIRLERHAHAFFQGNRYLLGDLVGAVVTALPAGDVVDLYAGVGLFAAAAAAAGDRHVTAVEGEIVAASDLKRNAAAYDRRVAARRQPVEAFLATARPRPDLGAVIVDPPRTGLTRDACAGILRLAPPRLIYVSCDPATLARDARRLIDAGCRLTSLRAFDLFPGTAHVESVAVFDR